MPASVVVVGASSGIGRTIGIGLAKAGNSVAFLGRRIERVLDGATEAGNGAIGIRCDVRDESGCTRAICEAARAFDGIDVLLYCAAIAPLGNLRNTSQEAWRDVLDTNVIGASIATNAALDYLATSSGRAIYLSSVSASVTPPWPGLGVYAASKAALDKMIEAWRGEHPEVRFTRVVLGDTAGGSGHGATEITATWDPEATAEHFRIWSELGYFTGEVVPIEDLVALIASVAESTAEIPSVSIIPAGSDRGHNEVFDDAVANVYSKGMHKD